MIEKQIMMYDGKDLVEMLPDNWDGKSRNMLVWCDDTTPIERIVCGYDPIHCVWLVAETQAGWSHCAEIPKEEKKTHRMTYAELAEWLAKGNGICAIIDKDIDYPVSSAHLNFMIDEANNEVPDFYKIRGWHESELREPLIEETQRHCVEIPKEEKKSRRMTYCEVAEWLAKGNGICVTEDVAFTFLNFAIYEANDEVPDCYTIRGWHELELHEPLIEE